MPIEVLAQRGMDAMRYGPMKPVGLRDPATGHRPWAVVQLRREDREGTLYNLVGFQTNLKFGEQKRVLDVYKRQKQSRAQSVLSPVRFRLSRVNNDRKAAERMPRSDLALLRARCV